MYRESTTLVTRFFLYGVVCGGSQPSDKRRRVSRRMTVDFPITIIRVLEVPLN